MGKYVYYVNFKAESLASNNLNFDCFCFAARKKRARSCFAFALPLIFIENLNTFMVFSQLELKDSEVFEKGAVSIIH